MANQPTPPPARATVDPLVEIESRVLPKHIITSIEKECEDLIHDLETLVMYAISAGNLPPTAEGRADFQIAQANLRDDMANIVGRYYNRRVFLEKIAQGYLTANH